MINDIYNIMIKPSPFIELQNYNGTYFYNMPRNKDNKIDIDICNLNYSYDIRVVKNTSDIVWDNDISCIRICVNINNFIIEDIYYYDSTLKTRFDKIMFSENDYYNEYYEYNVAEHFTKLLQKFIE